MKVSVIITSYNQEKYLDEAIQSVIQQECKPYEIIICDDYSTKDNSIELISSYARRYPDLIIPIFQPRNVGIPANRNAGFRAARGDFITSLDGDDRYLQGKLKQEIEVQKKTDADIVYSNQTCIGELGRKLYKKRYCFRKQREGDLFESICTITWPGPREMLIRKKCFDEIGFMNEELKTYEDWDFLIRLSKKYRFVACKSILVEHRIHAASIQYQSNVDGQLDRMIKVLQMAEKLCEGNLSKNELITKRRIKAFRLFIEAKKNAMQGFPKDSLALCFDSIKKDFRRSITYDLFLRLLFRSLFKSKQRIIDHMMIGPLGIPFYILREIYHRLKI